MNKKLILGCAAVAVAALMSVSCTRELFRGGKSDYSIVLADNASISERTAAKELQEGIQKISGATLPIVSETDDHGPAIHIGFTSKVASVTGEPKPAPDDETFTYRSAGKDILIWGGSEHGTMYGVFSFMEQQLGVRWYTSDKTVFPHMDSWKPGKLSHSESPAIHYRQTNYYAVEKDPVWNAHNLLNALWTPVSNEYGDISAYWGAHTMGWLVPSSEFFAKHPEYFSLIDGKRVPDAQLCLSNPEVLEICKERLIKAIDEHPGYWVYSLSQNDNKKPCTCEHCLELEEKYGGHSGLLLWFVNQVADEVKKVHPEKYVGTFAYQYTRQVPKDIVPRDNMVIRLCDIECCFGHPLDECPENESFMHDFAQWGKICDKIYIWDYVVNYAQYLAPFPNFGVLAANIRTYRDNNAIGVFEEAQYQSPAAEFCELRAWVNSKLLWNPDQDTDALVRDFISGYYGAVAPYIQEYFDMTQALVKDDTHFTIYFRHDNPLITDEYIAAASALLDKAREAAASDWERDEVDKIRLQQLYLKIRRNKDKSIEDGTYGEFLRIARKTGARISEGMDLERFLSRYDYPI